jgi:hypothetical protein
MTNEAIRDRFKKLYELLRELSPNTYTFKFRTGLLDFYMEAGYDQLYQVSFNGKVVWTYTFNNLREPAGTCVLDGPWMKEILPALDSEFDKTLHKLVEIEANRDARKEAYRQTVVEEFITITGKETK